MNRFLLLWLCINFLYSKKLEIWKSYSKYVYMYVEVHIISPKYATNFDRNYDTSFRELLEGRKRKK